MDATQITTQLQTLYLETHVQPLQNDEFTVGMFALANGCNSGTAGRLIQRAIILGRIESVGDRITQGRRARAFRFTN